MSRVRQRVALLPFLLPFAGCAVEDLPEERDGRGDPNSGEVMGDAAPAETPDVVIDAAPPAVVDAGVPDAGRPDAGVPDAGCVPELMATPSEIDFGSREIGTRNFEWVTITNACHAVRLYIDGTIPDDFGLTTAPEQPCPFGDELLAAGASCIVGVRFFPSETFIGWDASFLVIATATDPVTDAFVADVSIPVHGIAAPAEGG
jgi:hypothetical protein